LKKKIFSSALCQPLLRRGQRH